MTAIHVQGNCATEVRQSLFHKSLEHSLFRPIQSVLETRGKRLRESLIDCLLDSFIDRTMPNLSLTRSIIIDVIERLHAASMIIDDIEDNSRERRGLPTLHVSRGLPVALNAGCWLLFEPFERIKLLNLSSGAELTVLRAMHETILQAHEGQSVDLSTDATEVDQHEHYDLWMQTARRKTGALVALAAKLPCLVNERFTKIYLAAEFGRDFGVALQMFDDISDFFAMQSIPDDLKNRRLNWGLVVASKQLSREDFNELLSYLRLIETHKGDFDSFVEKHSLSSIARREAVRFLNAAYHKLKNSQLQPSPPGWSQLDELKEKLIHAYE